MIQAGVAVVVSLIGQGIEACHHRDRHREIGRLRESVPFMRFFWAWEDQDWLARIFLICCSPSDHGLLLISVKFSGS